jgi:hypothetical protein
LPLVFIILASGLWVSAGYFTFLEFCNGKKADSFR